MTSNQTIKMTPVCTVRRVQLSESSVLRNIAISTFIDTYAVHNTPENMTNYMAESFSESRLNAELNSDDTHFYFAVSGPDIYGYLKLNFRSAQTNQTLGRACEIERIYVVKEFQGLQVGKALYEQAIKTAQISGAKWLWLGVWDQNKKAIGFYEKMGLEVFGRHDFTLGDEEQSDLLMRLPIST